MFVCQQFAIVFFRAVDNFKKCGKVVSKMILVQLEDLHHIAVVIETSYPHKCCLKRN